MPEGTPGRPWWGCYVGERTSYAAPPEGFLPVSPLYAGPESATLIVGPPRSGKTSTLVIPTVLDAPAAMVSTSTKTDVLENTAYHRLRLGRVFLFDPTGSVPLPRWVTRLRWSPVVGSADFDHAVAMAHALGSAARPGAALTESAHWVERAQALIAPLLFAAARRGLDISAVCRWILARDLREPRAIVAESGHEMAEAVLTGVAATDERERSGIFSTASGLLSAYRSQAVLETAKDPNFDPVSFARSSDSLYICAPAQEQDRLAPLVVALLEQIRAAVLSRPPDAAPVVFALDEVANIAPLSSLPALAAEGGGQGLVTLACLQDLSQARVRWGEATEGFFTLFGTKVILPGVADRRTLQLISALAGEQQVVVPSHSHPNPLANFISGGRAVSSTTTTLQWRPRLPVDVIARGRPGHALFMTSSSMYEVRLLPWWEHAYFVQGGGTPGGVPWSEHCRLYPEDASD
jgi:type IV secretion system protein VirD4